MEWRTDLENVPKDGSRFLSYVPEGRVVSLDEDMQPIIGDHVRMTIWMGGDFEAVDGGGWDSISPTHWMPLPPRPTREERG